MTTAACRGRTGWVVMGSSVGFGSSRVPGPRKPGVVRRCGRAGRPQGHDVAAGRPQAGRERRPGRWPRHHSADVTTSYSPAVPPSEPDGPVRLKARRPSDLLAAVPFLLGFHPQESLVALFLESGRVRLTARYDLGDHLDLDVADLVDQHRPTGLVLVVYCADADRGRAALRDQAERLTDVDLVDLLLVDGERWWSLDCTTGCCPSEGNPYAPGDHPLSAEAVWAGLVARPDRAAVVATVAGPGEEEWAALRRLARPIRSRLARESRTDRQDALGRAVVAALPHSRRARGGRGRRRGACGSGRPAGRRGVPRAARCSCATPSCATSPARW